MGSSRGGDILRLSIQMSGPASRAPEQGKDDEAGEDSDRSECADEDNRDAGAAQPGMDYVHTNVAESTIALDPQHDVAPVRMMQALQGTIEALSGQAAQITKNERKAQIADNDGVNLLDAIYEKLMPHHAAQIL